MKNKLTIIKIGGNVIKDSDSLNSFLDLFAQVKGNKILVHGGGSIATTMAQKLGVDTQMVEGRRVTSKEMLDITIMCYAGLINKKMVSYLQTKKINSIGLSGADLNCISAQKRPPKNGIDYGFVGDINDSSVNTKSIELLIQNNFTPIFCSITHNKDGGLLNTNADTIATELACQLQIIFDVQLVYCFEKDGVLLSESDPSSLIKNLTLKHYQKLLSENIIHSGMIPKLENCFKAKNNRIHVSIKNAYNLLSPIETKIS